MWVVVWVGSNGKGQLMRRPVPLLSAVMLLWCASAAAQTHDGYAYCAQQAHAQIRPKERQGRARAYYDYYSACLAQFGLRPGYGTYHPSQQVRRPVDEESQLHLLLDDTDEQWERSEDNYEYMMQQQNYEDMRQEDDRWLDEQQRQAEENRQREENDRAYMEQRGRR